MVEITRCLGYFKRENTVFKRSHSSEKKSVFLIIAPFYVNSLRQNRFNYCNLHDPTYIFLDNVVMATPKRRILSFVFTVL